MGKWLRIAGKSLLAIFLLIVIAGVGFEQYGRYIARRDFPPEGKLVDIGGGRRLQLDCRGSGAPTVVLQAGLDTIGALSWAAIHDRLAANNRTCATSRAGIMWSDGDSGSHNGVAVAVDLHVALKAAGETGPFVMVGHSFGGPYSLIYTDLYPDEVAGLVFVDASHPGQEARFAKAGAGGGGVSTEISFMEKLPSNLEWMSVIRILEFLSPEPPLPNVSERTTAEVRAYSAVSTPALLAEVLAERDTSRRAAESEALGNRPLYVLTATKALSEEQLKGMGLSQEQGDILARTWLELHNEEATWSTRSQHVLVPDSTHYIQLRQPDRVIEGVEWVSALVRADEEAASAH